MQIALMYHDVVEPRLDDASGFPGLRAARYKLTHDEFLAHLDAIHAASAGMAVPLFTFDDGGASSVWIARQLERYGWRGYFFVTTDRIGSPGFVDADQILNLRSRGHTIGTHSCSHPSRISTCNYDEVLREWRDSRAVLAEILGEPVTLGSIPGGFYSRVVAEAAAEVGLRQLFTSEPTTRNWSIAGCALLGRYTVYRGMSAPVAAAIARGRMGPRAAQALTWQVKKLAKGAAGRRYEDLSRSILALLGGTNLG